MATRRSNGSMPKFRLETRSEFKDLLDFVSASAENISNLQEILSIGPNRDLIIAKSKIMLRMNESGKLYSWDPSDPRTATTCLVAVGEYEPIETRILKKFASESNVVVDIGANVGYYTIELAEMLPPSGKLISFEPVTTSFNQLEQNIKLNKFEKIITTFNLGLSDRDEVTKIFIPKRSGSSAASARNLHPDEEFTSQEITMTSLDKVFESLEYKTCNLIKIDVERGELDVIRGSIGVIKEFRPVIFAELLRKWSEYFSYKPNTVLEILQELGYICFGVSTQFRRIEVFTEDDIETNFIFIHEEQLVKAVRIFKKIAKTNSI